MDATPETKGTKRSRTGKWMATAMVAVLAAVALGSGLGPVSQPAQATHLLPWTSYCSYEADTGDVAVVMKNDQTGLTSDGYIDNGGCIWNRPNHGECVTAVTRGEGGLAAELGDLALGEIATRISLDVADCPASIETDLREFDDDFADATVDISVSVSDDAFATEISGLICTEGIDDDHIGCETGQLLDNREYSDRICGGAAELEFIPMDRVNHIVVFIDGPASATEVNQNEDCPSTVSAIGGTTGGIFDPNDGITVTVKDSGL